MVWLAVNSPLSDNKHLLITEEQVVGVEEWGGEVFTWESFTPRAGLNAAAPFILGLLTQALLLLNYSNYNLQPRRILLLLPLRTSDRRAQTPKP